MDKLFNNKLLSLFSIFTYIIFINQVFAKDNKDFIDISGSLCKPFLGSTDETVVLIQTQFNDEKLNCTGVIFLKNQILTAKHCITLLSGKPDLIKAVIQHKTFFANQYQSSSKADMLILTFGEDLPVKNVARVSIKDLNDYQVRAGHIVGFGCNHERLKKNILFQKSTYESEIIVIGCICHGDSGGALFNENNELIGIVSNTREDGQHGTAQNIFSF
jgi:hypothetical protein